MVHNIQASLDMGRKLGCPVLFNMITPNNPKTIFDEVSPYLKEMYDKVL